jgi:hypothetical protein
MRITMTNIRGPDRSRAQILSVDQIAQFTDSLDPQGLAEHITQCRHRAMVVQHSQYARPSCLVPEPLLAHRASHYLVT